MLPYVQPNMAAPGALFGLCANPFLEVSQENAANAGSPANNTRYYPADEAWVRKAGSVVLSGQQIANPFASAGYRRLRAGLKCTATTAQAAYAAGEHALPFGTIIEGTFFAGLGWGTGDAQDALVVLVLSASATGNYAVSLRNSATDRSYVNTIALVANTPRAVAIRVPGDTAGTWLTTTGIGVYLMVGMVADASAQAATLNAWLAGSYTTHASALNWAGTLNATVTVAYANVFPYGTLPIAAVAGAPTDLSADALNWILNVRRGFDDYLTRCKRYWQSTYDYGMVPGTASATGSQQARAVAATTTEFGLIARLLPMRAAPSVTVYSPTTGASNNIRDGSAGADYAVSSMGLSSTLTTGVPITSSVMVQGNAYQAHYACSARL